VKALLFGSAAVACAWISGVGCTSATTNVRIGAMVFLVLAVFCGVLAWA
jgi:hypothetical protein